MLLTRLIIATIVAPLAASVISILLSIGGSLPLDDSGIALYFGVGAAFAYLGFFLGGVPILIALRRLRRLNLAALVVAGAILGIFVFHLSLIVLAMSLKSIHGLELLSVAHGALAGGVVAFLFGVIAGQKNLRSKSNAH